MAEFTPQSKFTDPKRVDLSEMIPLEQPIVIYIESSSFCNLKCKFCPQYVDPDNLVKGFLDINLFRKTLEDLRKLTGGQKIKMLRFCGTGESTMHPKFSEIIDMAHKSNLFGKIELITNGILLKGKLADEISKKVDRVIVSIEGLSDDAYKSVAGVKVNVNGLAENLELFSKIEKRSAKLHIKIHSKGIENEEDFTRFKNMFGFADEIYVEGLVDLWPGLETSLGEDVTVHRFDGGKLNKTVACPQIFKSLQLQSDGRVIPCCIDYSSMNSLGNISDMSLGDIWKGESLKKLRIAHLRGERFEFEPCKSCSHNEFAERDNIDGKRSQILDRIMNNKLLK